MKIIQEISDLQHIPKGGVQTIGNFDGVHIGHQEIAASRCRPASGNGARSADSAGP